MTMNDLVLMSNWTTKYAVSVIAGMFVAPLAYLLYEGFMWVFRKTVKWGTKWKL